MSLSSFNDTIYIFLNLIFNICDIKSIIQLNCKKILLVMGLFLLLQEKPWWLGTHLESLQCQSNTLMHVQHAALKLKIFHLVRFKVFYLIKHSIINTFSTCFPKHSFQDRECVMQCKSERGGRRSLEDIKMHFYNNECLCSLKSEVYFFFTNVL